MSMETVKQVIGRAVIEKEYRELLFSEPEKALAEYDLSEEEVASLVGMEREAFDATANELEERISRAGFGGGLLSESFDFSSFDFGGDDLFGVGITVT